jgi:hypothetical protein
LTHQIQAYAALTHIAPVLAELFSQSRRKIRPLKIKFGPPGNFPFLKEFGLRKNTIFVCVSGQIKIFLGHFPRNREDKRREIILLIFSHFLFKISQNLATEWSDRSFFMLPFSTYAAEQSANSQQHCMAP